MPTLADEILADSPLGYWKLDEASGSVAADSSGNSRHGAYANGPTLGVPGFTQGGDNAAKLDTPGQRVTIPAAAVSLASAFTLEIWVSLADVSKYCPLIVRRDASTSGFDWSIGASASGQPRLDIFGGTHSSGFGPAGAVTANQPTHMAVVFDGTKSTTFLNGAPLYERIGTGAPDAPGQDLTIASRVIGSPALGGWAQHAAIYPTALSASRVAAHYLAGRTALAQSAITAQSVLTSPIHADSPMSANITATSATTAGISPDIPIGQTNLIALSNLSAAPRATVGRPFTLVGARDDYLTLEGADAS